MSLDRRQLLRGSLAIGAAAVPFGALAAPAHGIVRQPQAQVPRAGFSLALLDANNQIITNHHTGDIRNGKFGKPWATFRTGQGAKAWDPLELKVRKLQSGETAFLICGGDRTEGHMTIHRNSDGAPLGWVSGLTNFPHSLEYLSTPDVIIVVGTQGLDSLDPKPPEASRSGGCYELYLAPTRGSAGPLRKIPVQDEDRAFRQAHGVVWDETKQFLWIFGGNKIRAYTVTGKREHTRLKRAKDKKGKDIELVSSLFENGHDLQPDPLEPQYLWATSSKEIIQINKAGGYPRIQWSIPARSAKSFSRDRSGSAVWTSDTKGNAYGDDKVRFLWSSMTDPVTAERASGETKDKWIYKARLLDI
ncbi:hypothetical protein V7793_07900 [Streptomyces sp. KLMMK]|uniref:hypothetical protein n=1 Tax=Streptomyces sp. KLMMK TaxID=3109353 RepID=UPI0030084C0D